MHVHVHMYMSCTKRYLLIYLCIQYSLNTEYSFHKFKKKKRIYDLIPYTYGTYLEGVHT